MKNIKQIKKEQKELLLKEIVALEHLYKKWCSSFIKKLAPDTRKNCKDVIEEQLRYEWDTVYEPQDKQLQLALIHFERYEKEYSTRSYEELIKDAETVLAVFKKK